MTNAADILLEFVEVLGAEHVILRRRGGTPGYVHVLPAGFEPEKRRDRLLLVELHNGTIGVTDELKEVLKAQARVHARIESHPLGYSAGPNYGRFSWGITFPDAQNWKGGIRGFVHDACVAIQTAKRRSSSSTVGDDGDYS